MFRLGLAIFFVSILKWPKDAIITLIQYWAVPLFLLAKVNPPWWN